MCFHNSLQIGPINLTFGKLGIAIFIFMTTISMGSTATSRNLHEYDVNTVQVPVSYTHLDVYKRQT